MSEMMNPEKRKKLEAAGWAVGTTEDFLELTPEEKELIELRLSLSKRARELRKRKGWTQQELATYLGSSQARIAKLEAGDPSVSMDFIFKVVFALGETRQTLINER